MEHLAVVTSLLSLFSLFPGPVNGGLSDNYMSTGEAPYIVEQPLDVTVARHQPATLNCRAGGSPTPTISWYKAGQLVVSDTHRSILPAGGLFFLRAIHYRAHYDAGVYWCEANNSYGTARSRNATLHVAVLREEFRLEPTSAQTAQGETLILECLPPRGTPEPNVYWKKNGQILHFDGDSRMHLVDGGSLVIQDARQTDAGRYQCIARNAAGTRESAIATLRVHIKPYLITGPEDIVAHTGGSVTFQCRVGGDPLPYVLWRRTAGGGSMSLGRVKVLDDRSLRLDKVIIGDEGEYTCEADNSVGAVSARGYLTVYDPPSVTLSPTSVNIEIGITATFNCSATGKPQPTLFWSIEGNRSIILPGTFRGRYHASAVLDGVSILTVSNSSKNDSGKAIVCSAVNFAGSSFVRGKLTVTSDDDRPPPIIIHGPTNQTLPIKSMAVFPCTAIATPEPLIAWYFEGEALIQNHRRNVSNDGTLILRDLEKSDSGRYTCVASSHHGKYVWSGVLLVNSPTNPNIHFFRTADFSSLPVPPSKPQLYNITESSVMITWNQRNKIGSSPILGYQVELFPRETLTGNTTPRNSRGWVVLAKRVHQTQFTAKNLVSGVTYMFIVRTENSHGLSAPSPTSEPITIADEKLAMWETGVYSNNTELRNNIMTDNIVELVEATPIDSKTIKLMLKILNFYYLEGLFIYFRPLDNTTTEYDIKTILHSNDASSPHSDNASATLRFWYTKLKCTSRSYYGRQIPLSIRRAVHTFVTVSIKKGCFPSNGKIMDALDARFPPDEELYPASDGGYYYRNVYSEKYFQRHPNVLKFYDLPSSDNTQNAHVPCNLGVYERTGDTNAKTEVTQSLIGRTYGIKSRKNSDADTTYRAFGEEISDDEKSIEDGGYDKLQATQQQRQRFQHQYERPNFDNDTTSTLAKLTSFKKRVEESSQTSLASTHPPPAPHPRVESITR